tara:strand:+ start:120 stop:464 length:345 start_codon:yes stop_codon:yes gene_type:complete
MATKDQLWEKLMTSTTKPSVSSPVKDMGAWGKIKKYHATGMGKVTIYGSAAALGIKAALVYGLYKAGQSSGQRKSVSQEVREINKWAKQKGLTTPEELKTAYRAAHKRRKYMAG